MILFGSPPPPVLLKKSSKLNDDSGYRDCDRCPLTASLKISISLAGSFLATIKGNTIKYVAMKIDGTATGSIICGILNENF